MIRHVLILFLVALQWPQALAGMLVVCLCEEGVSLAAMGGGCHCGEPRPPGDDRAACPIHVSNHCGDELYSFFAGDSLQNSPAPAIDLDVGPSFSLPIALAPAVSLEGAEARDAWSCTPSVVARGIVLRC